MTSHPLCDHKVCRAPHVAPRTGYSKYGCRCASCKAANSAYVAVQKRKWRAANGPAVERDREASRRWKAEHPEEAVALCMTTCACGKQMRTTSARCQDCEVERRQEVRRITQRMWHAGATLKEIAAALGTTPQSVGVKIAQMRNAGWDMPRRGPGGRILEVAA